MKSRCRENEEILALATYVKLMRAAECITTRVHRHLADSSLSVSQFGVLEALYHLGSLCQRDLACKLLKSGGNITMVVANLEKRQLVKRTRSEQDRRFYQVELTRAGEKLIEEIFPRHAAGIAKEFSVLKPEEMKALQQYCLRLGMKGVC